ncbi:MAG TPA: RNA polymerase sigma factor, partial [Streptosporangiaceae bacterium]|nr:RNA polymerase sigma factor [Streptosporangiaceae bacterium]
MASLSPADPRPESGDRDTFAEMFDQHARHLFDYCLGLLGNRARAASATQLTLIAGHSLVGRLQDPSRMRAWLLALGRWECLNGNRAWSGAGGSPQPAGAAGDLGEALAFLDAADDDVADHGPTELTRAGADAADERWVRAALDALPRADREILDLVYRHAVSLAELPAVLGIPARNAPDMLAAARAKLEKSAAAADQAAAEDDARAAAGHWADAVNPPQARTTTSPAYRLAAVPLATLPPSVWRRTARVVMDPRFRSYREAVSAHAEHLGPDGFPAQVEAGQPPSNRKLLLASALMAGLLLAPAAAGAVGYAAFAGPAAASAPGARRGDAPVVSSSGTSAGSGVARSSGHTKRSGSKRPGSKAPGKSAGGVAPQPGTSAPGSRKHSGSPSPTSRFSS